MKIPCVSCQSLFRLDSSLVKSTGSLVRCSKCKYIFMVYPPTLNEEPIVKDTNIDQSILFDLFNLERKSRANGILDKTSEKFKSRGVEEIASIENFDQEEPDPENENGEYADLPDLSEYEALIDCGEFPDEADLTEHEKQFLNSTQDLDINEA
jgi:predicted Zn finger-like uncharacterized protein